MLATEAMATVETLRRLHASLRGGGAEQRVTSALDAAAQAVVDAAGFEVTSGCVVDGDELVIVAVAGPDEARHTLVGRRSSRATWERLLAEADKWGALGFHRDPRALLGDAVDWAPPRASAAPTAQPRNGSAESWQSSNTLLAPIRSARGELVAVLKVDQPTDGLLPDQAQTELVEIIAGQTGLALENDHLIAQLDQQLTDDSDRATWHTERHPEQPNEPRDQRLRTSEETLRLAFDNAAVGMCLVRPDVDGPGQIVGVNDALCRMFGYSRGDIEGMAMTDLVELDSDQDQLVMLEAAAAGQIETYRSECRCRRADQTVFWGQLHLAVVPATDTGPPLMLGQIVDVTASKQSAEELAHRAAHDPLTGLVNRTVTVERLSRLLEGPREHERPGAVLFCDLDHFKQVNDAYGHLIGDEVLAQVARRVAGVVRRSDTVGRYGGDEFLVVVPEISADEARELAVRIARSVDEPILVNEVTCRVGVSVGIVVLTGARSAPQVLEGADEAMYRAKTRHGHERYVVHDLA